MERLGYVAYSSDNIKENRVGMTVSAIFMARIDELEKQLASVRAEVIDLLETALNNKRKYHELKRQMTLGDKSIE